MARITKLSDDLADYNYRRSWLEALGGFLTWKKAQGIAEQTYTDYNRHVRQFFTRNPDAWESDDALKATLYAYLSEDIKPATYNNRLVYLRTYLNWCVDNGYLNVNPIKNIKKKKDEGRAVKIDTEVLKQLLAQPDQRTFTGLRDYTLMLLTLDCGIRPKEALSLVPMDFNGLSYEIYVPPTVAKTRVSRTLHITDVTVTQIKKLLAVRPKDWGDDVPIFCTYEGKPLNRNTWGDRIEMYTKRIGVHIRPYDLRHAFSIEFLRGGANSFALQKTLGHTSMEMTRRYVNLIDDDLKEEHAKASPLNKLVNTTKRATKI
ncbi:site-specific integrase [Neobacillus mesonae]|nr:site-specific integrase [Neobacillus mesonae]